MTGNSRTIASNQLGVHGQLASVVARHLQHRFRAGIAPHNREAYAVMREHASTRPYVLDSGCGTGASTARLAERFPDHAVIGIDKSSARLGRHDGDQQAGNYCLLRADLLDIWRLAAADGWHPARHFIYYPNPWPKKRQLQRRWHGSPVFPDLLTLGGQLELRSNWRIYIDEFQEALRLAGFDAHIEACTPIDERPVSPFERKYRDSGHSLWQLHCNLDTRHRQPQALNWVASE